MPTFRGGTADDDAGLAAAAAAGWPSGGARLLQALKAMQASTAQAVAPVRAVRATVPVQAQGRVGARGAGRGVGAVGRMRAGRRRWGNVRVYRGCLGMTWAVDGLGRGE
jgi:hypothetical protein